MFDALKGTIMKKLLLICACLLSLASCSSLTTPIAATSNPVCNKLGEASYKTYFWGLFGRKGANVGIDKAVKNAGITKISHVDYTVKHAGFLGSRTIYTTKVYGE